MPGMSPIPSSPSSTSTVPTHAPTHAPADDGLADAQRSGTLTALPLSRLLCGRETSEYHPTDVWATLVNPQSYAGRELRDTCDAANPGGPLFLEMVTLLTTNERERTVDRLADAGIFVAPARRQHGRHEDTLFLQTDEGLTLWLQYAALPGASQNVFDSSDVYGESTTVEQSRIDAVLRILVACGRDASDAAPFSDAVPPLNPLSHLASQVAPQWLPRLLALGVDPNQVNNRGTPLVVAAMRAEAIRLRLAGRDPLAVHASLCHLGRLLKRHGADLQRSSRVGAPPVAILTFHGHCGAAEALLSIGADPNTPDQNGHTLMHHLAHNTREIDTAEKRATAHLAHYLLIVATRYGGDLDRTNSAGQSARSFVPRPLSLDPHMSRQFVDSVRETAMQRIRVML
ncbi:hypothetical protein RO07_00685 [Pandoraea pulmonicola]|uniref:Ankyrin repeats (3 copies) n=2 Tax=Pandoraea pulmonicola TaxID=93221 RepID=A0AAJ4ZFV6_PANPU|nr:hypothetical protein RO07_00685 [Pandoraea pulmonicola]SUA92622.1 Ankyrin repeats (3 copies) [Pandoraea pulmonicola]